MPKKCNSCKHCVEVEVPRFRFRPTSVTGDLQTVKVCKNDLCTTEEIRKQFPDRHGMPLDMAREICNKEGDGIFVYFEPKEPAAGAAAYKDCPDCEHTILPGEDHICRTPKSTPVQPDDWRKEMHQHFTKAA